MTKTFYSVKCAVFGGGTTDVWFDNLTEAKEFAKADFRDNPVRHTYKNPETIKEIEKIIAMQ